jgi:hypothetical protein
MWHLYVTEGRVILPTVALTEVGFYWDVDPCSVVELADRDGLKNAIQAMVGRGHPHVPTPPQESFKRPVVLKFTTARSVRTFEKKTSFWTLSETEGSFVVSRGKRSDRGGWQPDPHGTHTLPRKPLEDVAEDFAEIVQRHELENAKANKISLHWASRVKSS